MLNLLNKRDQKQQQQQKKQQKNKKTPATTATTTTKKTLKYIGSAYIACFFLAHVKGGSMERDWNYDFFTSHELKSTCFHY